MALTKDQWEKALGRSLGDDEYRKLATSSSAKDVEKAYDPGVPGVTAREDGIDDGRRGPVRMLTKSGALVEPAPAPVYQQPAYYPTSQPGLVVKTMPGDPGKVARYETPSKDADKPDAAPVVAKGHGNVAPDPYHTTPTEDGYQGGPFAGSGLGAVKSFPPAPPPSMHMSTVAPNNLNTVPTEDGWYAPIVAGSQTARHALAATQQTIKAAPEALKTAPNAPMAAVSNGWEAVTPAPEYVPVQKGGAVMTQAGQPGAVTQAPTEYDEIIAFNRKRLGL